MSQDVVVYSKDFKAAIINLFKKGQKTIMFKDERKIL